MKNRIAFAEEFGDKTQHQENSEPLFLTSSFSFRTAAEAAEKFSDNRPDNFIYSRFSNPTAELLEHRIARLEGAELALTTSSGMAAILATVMGLCKSGDRILCAENVFGATVRLLDFLGKFGLRTDFIPSSGLDAWRQAADKDVALVLVETPSNPMQEVVDLAELSAITRAIGAHLVVDNCFCAGAQRPLEWGADLVTGSATKYLDGQGRVLGGIIAGRRELLLENIYPFLRSGGPAISPFNAWVIAKSLETLSLRVTAHSRAALDIAAWLEGQPMVRSVRHTALPSHPDYALAMKQQNGMGGGLIAVDLHGGQDTAWRFIDFLQHFTITANFGDSKSLVTHPITTTHRRLSPEALERMGLTDSLVRLSIGLEDVDTLKADLEQSLKRAADTL